MNPEKLFFKIERYHFCDYLCETHRGLNNIFPGINYGRLGIKCINFTILMHLVAKI